MEIYKISQIIKLLGLSSDTTHFYGKKGLVHPSVNPDNRYREYGLDNTLELLGTVYYRHLDIFLQDIWSIYVSRSGENVYKLLLKKKQEAKEKIRYEQQLLKKLACVSEIYQRVESSQNICSIKTFPASTIPFESGKTSDFFTQQIAHPAQDQFVFCSLFRIYHIDNCDTQPGKTTIVLEQDIMEELYMDYPWAQLIKTHKQPCMFLVIYMLHSQIHPEDITPPLTYAAKQKPTLQNALYLWEILLTSYQDGQNYHTELYTPVCEG